MTSRAPARSAKAATIPRLPGRVMGRHRDLLSDPNVRSWWEARSLRSRLSADQNLRILGFLLERLDLDPCTLVTLARKEPDRLRTLLIREATRLKAEGRLESYIAKLLSGVRAYFRFHHVAFDGFPSLSPIEGESLAQERIPTPEELGRVLDRLSLRGRVIALFMAHAGLRPGVLGSYQAEGGLTLGDLPDLSLGKEPRLSESPFVVRVPARLSKTRRAYTTFGSSQLATALLAYLTDRRQRGEDLAPTSPVVTGQPTRGVARTSRATSGRSKGFVTTKVIVEEVRDALAVTAPAGVRWRPYVLRSYCSTRLLIAEGSGKITRDLREALLGHGGGISARYNVGKTWGPELLKEARGAYRKAEPSLLTVSVPDIVDTKTEARKEVLLTWGFSEEELDGLDVKGLDAAGFQALARSKGPSAPAERASAPASPPRQKVVDESEIEPWLEKGWTVHTSLAGGRRVVLNPPQS